MKKLFRGVLNLGCGHFLSDSKNRQVKWVNQVTFIGVISAFFYGLIFCVLSYFKLAASSFIFTSLFMLSFYLSSKRRYEDAQLWLLIVTNISVLFFAVITGPKLAFDTFFMTLLTLFMLTGYFLKKKYKKLIFILPTFGHERVQHKHLPNS